MSKAISCEHPGCNKFSRSWVLDVLTSCRFLVLGLGEGVYTKNMYIHGRFLKNIGECIFGVPFGGPDV